MVGMVPLTLMATMPLLINLFKLTTLKFPLTPAGLMPQLSVIASPWLAPNVRLLTDKVPAFDPGPASIAPPFATIMGALMVPLPPKVAPPATVMVPPPEQTEFTYSLPA